MIIGSYNGWDIVGTPDSPSLKQISWNAEDVIGELTSPFSGQSQQQDWDTDWWSGQLALPPLTAAQAAAWYSFLLELRGKLNVFRYGCPMHKAPAGQALGAVVADGTNSPRARILNTRGWNPSVQGQLLIGDYLQVAERLHVVIATNVDSDANGRAAINIWPALREGAAATTRPSTSPSPRACSASPATSARGMRPPTLASTPSPSK